MKMGAKFKETPPYNKRQSTHLYLDAIQKLTNKVARFAKSKSTIFYSWKGGMTQDIDKTLKSLPNTLKFSCILNKLEVCKYVNFLHARFVKVPVDKARNTSGIMCKEFYLHNNQLDISDDGNIIGN